MENEPRKSSECPFCNPAQSDGSNRILRENASAYITLSNPRKMPGHMLVIPKRHIETPWELSESEILDIFKLIAFTQQQVMAHKLGEGTQIRQNYMPFVPEGTTKVNHVHYHVMPRTFNDEMYTKADHFENELFASVSNEERAKIEPLFS